MIKHVVLTNEDEAMILCYRLAVTLTTAQRRAGTLAYSSVYPHPTDTNLFAVYIDTAHADVASLVEAQGYTPVTLDDTWHPDLPLELLSAAKA